MKGKMLVALAALVCMFTASVAYAQPRGGRFRGDRRGYYSPSDPVRRATMNTLSYVNGPFQMGSQYLCDIWGPNSAVGQSHCFRNGWGAGSGYDYGYGGYDYPYQQQYYRRGHRSDTIISTVGGAVVGFVIGRVTAPKERRHRSQEVEESHQQTDPEAVPVRRAKRFHFLNRTGCPVIVTSETLADEVTLEDGSTFQTTDSNPGFRPTRSCHVRFIRLSTHDIDLVCQGGK